MQIRTSRNKTRIKMKPVFWITCFILTAVGTYFDPKGKDKFYTCLLLYASGTIIHFGWPTRNIASTVGTVLALLSVPLSLEFRKWGMFARLNFYWDTIGCTVHTTEHYGPGDNITWEAWTTGKWCTSHKSQVMALKRASEVYRPTIEGDMQRCSRTCWRPNISWDDTRFFVTSSPGGTLPGTQYCGRGTLKGFCPLEDDCSYD